MRTGTVAMDYALQRVARVWVVALILCVSWYYGSSLISTLTPASAYLDVRSVHVDDATIGVPPKMQVDRAINHNFHGRWNVDVERMTADGRFVQVCQAHGEGNYATDNDLPEDLDLDWWTYPVKCTPTVPGKYRVETVWVIELASGLTKEVRIISNTFEVR